MKRITILLAALALTLAACGDGQADPTPEPTITPQPTPEVTPEPEPTDGGLDMSPGAFPSFDLDGDPELAARFPTTVGGQPLMVQSFRGDAFMAMGVDESFQDFLDSTGAELEDVSVAFGGGSVGETFLSVAAFRVLGVPQERLEEEFLGAAAEDLPEDLTRATIGGKQVWTAQDPTGELGGGVYVYSKDDTLYWLTGPEELVAEILEALP